MTDEDVDEVMANVATYEEAEAALEVFEAEVADLELAVTELKAQEAADDLLTDDELAAQVAADDGAPVERTTEETLALAQNAADIIRQGVADEAGIDTEVIRPVVAEAASIPEGDALDRVTMREGIEMLKRFQVFTDLTISPAELAYATSNFITVADTIGKREGVPAAMIAYLLQEVAMQEINLVATAILEAQAAEVVEPVVEGQPFGAEAAEDVS